MTRGELTTMKDILGREAARLELRAKLATGTATIPPYEVTYTCATCQDVGFVRLEIDDHLHTQFGKLQPCPDCRNTRATTSNVDMSGLHPEERALDWSDLLKLEGDYNLRGAEMVVKRTLVRRYGWVYLWGSYGLGKTLLLKIAAARSLVNNLDAMYVKAEYMLDHLRTSIKTDTFEKVVDTYIKVPVLCIEEFEKINHTEWRDTRLFHILDDRYDRATRRMGMMQGVTLFAANVGPEQITDRALRSRIMDERFEVFKLTGRDVRQVSKQLSKGE